MSNPLAAPHRYVALLLLLASLAVPAAATTPAGCFPDAAGDAVKSAQNPAPPDITQTCAVILNGVLYASVRFASGTFSQNTTFTQVEFDTDRNTQTGGLFAGLGIEYFIDIAGGTQGTLYRYAQGFPTVGTFPVTYSADGVDVAIPVSAIGNPNGAISFLAVTSISLGGGSTTGILDYGPDAPGTSGNGTAPVIFSISPTTAAAGTNGFTMTVNGLNFTQGASAYWNGTALSSTVISYSQISAVVPASLLASAGTAIIQVTTALGTSPGVDFTINPPGQACTFTIPTSSAGFAANGGSGSLAVSASRTDCVWSAISSVTWITFTGGPITGSGTLNYTVAANPAGTSRTGVITIGTRTFTVTQAGTLCTFALPVSSQAFASAGGSGSASVKAPPGCAWTAGSDVPWVAITPPSSGSGNGSVGYTVSANTGTASRSGTLTIANLPYTVTQAGTAVTRLCTASVPSVPQVALEGRTVQLGDYLLTCSGLTEAVTADITLTLNTNVTNAIANGATDATLTVNSGTVLNGRVAGYNSIRWTGVGLIPAGNGTATLRISRVRADASLLASPGSLLAAAITGQAAIRALTAIPISAPLQTLANARQFLLFTRNQAVPPAGGAQTLVPLFFDEAIASAFQAGVTRLRMVLTNLPAGLQVYAPVFPTEGNTRAQLYSADSNGSGGSPLAGAIIAGSTYQLLAVTGGTATATWLVQVADAAQLETFTFPLLILNASTANLNQIAVAGTLAPVIDVGIASASAPVPRFRDFSVPLKLVSLRLTTSLFASALPSGKAPTRDASGLAPKAAVSVGSKVTFTSQLVNDTSDTSQTATNVVIRDSLPSGLSLIGCTATAGVSCNTSGNQVEVTVPTLGAGQTATVTVEAQVSPSVPDGTVVENPVSAAGDQVTSDLTAASASTSFIVLSGSPVVAGGTPSSGAGGSQAFTFQFTHASGYQNLVVANILINKVLDGRNACYLAYVVATNTLVLVNNEGAAGGPYAGTLTLGTAGTIQNSQCIVALTSAVGDGTTLTLTLNIAFLAAFGGNRIAYVAARDQGQGNTDWQALGVWQPPFTPPGAIAVTGVTPARGAAPSGTSRQFQVTLTDNKGVGDFGVINLLVNRAIDGRQACYLAYVAATNQLILVNDAGDAGGPYAGGMTLNGGNTSIQNSQCAVSGAGSTVSFAPNTLNLTLNITFLAPFAGNRVLYVAGRDVAGGNNTDWQAMATFTVQ